MIRQVDDWIERWKERLSGENAVSYDESALGLSQLMSIIDRGVSTSEPQS